MTRRDALPVAALLAGAVAVGLLAIVTAVQVTAIGLDENVYKYAAVQHYERFPFGVLHENTSRGAARLYSFLISPLFAIFAGDVAVRVARALNGVLFAATAIPVALLARRVTTSPWSAVAAGLLTIAVPWLTLATVMFTESLAYLLLACTALAMTRALEAPSVGRELVVLGLIFALVLTRVQFLVLAPAWVLLVVLVEGRGVLRRARTRWPLTLGAVALTLIAVLAGVAAGRARPLAGPYYGIIERDTLPGNFGLGLLWEVSMLSLGAGLLPVVLAAPWLVRAVARREGEETRRFGLLATIVVASLFAATLWAQGGFLGASSEERYFIYAIPFVWLAAVAAIERGTVSRGALAGTAAALAAIVALVPNPVGLVGEQAYLGPVSLSLVHAMPNITEWLRSTLSLGAGAVQGGDVLGLTCALLGAGLVAAWGRGVRARWIALVPAIALQLFFVVYAFSALHDKLDGVGGTVLGGSFGDLAWVDRTVSGDKRATMLDNVTAPAREGLQRTTFFWNDELTDIYYLGPMQLPPSGFPMLSLPSRMTQLRDDLGTTVEPANQLAVGMVDSPLWQLEGSPERTSPDGILALERVETSPRVTWAAVGLDVDAQLTRPVELHAAGGHRVAIDLAAPAADVQAVATFRLGDRTRTFDTAVAAEDTLTFDLCDDSGPVTGTAEPTTPVDIGGRASAALVRGVRIERC